jgi:hypothetical protein
MHLEIMTHSESVHLCAELKTDILAVLTDMSGLGDSYRIVDHHCNIMLNYYCYYYTHVNAYSLSLLQMIIGLLMRIGS